MNLGALALLGAVLATGAEPGGLAGQWGLWPIPASAALAIGLVGFRFPRAAGIPLLVAVVACVWMVAGGLKPFRPLDAGTAMPTAQPLTDRELVTAFAWRVDLVSPPRGLPLVSGDLVRFRQGNAVPGEWWWTWAEGLGLARSEGAPEPPRPVKFGIYRMRLARGGPTWVLEVPELAPPGE